MTKPTARRVDVVIPAFNEAAGLAGNLEEIARELRALSPEYQVGIILVDDGSRDATFAAMQAFCESHGAATALRLTRNFGKEAAIVAGLAASTGDAVVVMDSDLQHPPALVVQLVQEWQRGALLVNAVKRRRQEEGLPARMFAHGFYWLFRKFSGLELQGASDFKLLDRRVVDYYLALPEREKFFRGLVAWAGFGSRDVAFDVGARRIGASQWSQLRLFRYAWSNLCSFSSLPLRLVSLLGMGAIIVSATLLVVSLGRYLAGTAVTGFTTVIALLVLLSGVQLVSLGILGSFVARIFNETKGRPEYLVAERFDVRGHRS